MILTKFILYAKGLSQSKDEYLIKKSKDVGIKNVNNQN